MTNHTPGPWVIYPETDGSEINAVDMKPGLPVRQPIAQVLRYGNWIANARLIAAAPELLDALESIITVSVDQSVTWQRAKDAIAKAKGVQ